MIKLNYDVKQSYSDNNSNIIMLLKNGLVYKAKGIYDDQPAKLDVSHVDRLIVGYGTDYYCPFCIRDDGLAYAMPNAYMTNGNGEFGLGHTNPITVPTLLPFSNIKDIVTSNRCTHILLKDGTDYACGGNQSYQSGTGSDYTITTPKKVALSNIKKISMSRSITAFLLNDGKVYVSGSSKDGSLGMGVGTTYDQPKMVGLSDVVDVQARDRATVFLLKDGSVFNCGTRQYTALGYTDATRLDVVNTPTEVNVPHNVKEIIPQEISSSSGNYLFLMNDGTTYGCGFNGNGELGLGYNGNNILTPVKLPFTNIKKTAGGQGLRFYMTYDNTMYKSGNKTKYLPAKMELGQDVCDLACSTPPLAPLVDGNLYQAENIMRSGYVITEITYNVASSSAYNFFGMQTK